MELQLILSKIYEIRGYKIMLDRDLAEMYGVETRALNQAVKRNINRFPNDFMFQLSEDESEILMSQIVISSWGGIRKLPFAFTELGVAMLSSILTSQTAIQINISIMRAFTTLRQLVLNPSVDRIGELQSEMQKLKQSIEDIFTNQNDINEDTRIQLEIINQTLVELQANKQKEKPRRPIGYTPPTEI
ncbi:MAG: ORF6N domain-containing protein [Paludibacter sp.]|nr:ORF6N domain-containing protein [Paludibacter sp.]